MVTVFVRVLVRDYASWKKAFDDFAPHRRAGGELRYRIGRTIGDADNLCLFLEWESLSSAGEFLSSPEFADAMKRGGVLERPEVIMAEEVASGDT